MTRTVLGEPRTASARLWSCLRDTATVTRMYSLRARHELDTVAVSVIMPVFFIVLFTYVFGSSIAVPDGDYKSYLLSGMLAQGALFSTSTVALAVAADQREGIMDRLRTMPVARTAVLLGRMASTLVVGLPGFAVTVGCAFAVGLRTTSGLGDIVLAFLLILSFYLAMCWAGVLIGLVTSSPAAANGLTMGPMLLLAFISNVTVDTATMPAVLRTVAEWNPLSAVVTAVRELLRTTGGTVVPDVVTLRHPIVTTVVMTVLLFAVLVPLSVRRFSSATR
ncbi:ABC transporter permease [Actinophytocola sp.]|uniref:ABC transporter permease n=1 Tax=Actinophytocola sp. TaxID=1872138 RepID=UPI002ED9D8AF